MLSALRIYSKYIYERIRNEQDGGNQYDGVMLRWRPPTQRPLFSHHNNRLTDAILTAELNWCAWLQAG